MYEKIWHDHLVRESQGDTSLLYVDLHLVHEVTSPQAFEGARLNKRSVRRPAKTFATMDHNVSTRTKYISLVEKTRQVAYDILESDPQLDKYPHLRAKLQGLAPDVMPD